MLLRRSIFLFLPDVTRKGACAAVRPEHIFCSQQLRHVTQGWSVNNKKHHFHRGLNTLPLNSTVFLSAPTVFSLRDYRGGVHWNVFNFPPTWLDRVAAEPFYGHSPPHIMRNSWLFSELKVGFRLKKLCVMRNRATSHVWYNYESLTPRIPHRIRTEVKLAVILTFKLYWIDSRV